MHAHWRPLEQVELVQGAIERIEQSIMAQGNRDANCNCPSHEQSCEYPFTIDRVIVLKELDNLVLQHPQ